MSSVLEPLLLRLPCAAGFFVGVFLGLAFLFGEGRAGLDPLRLSPLRSLTLRLRVAGPSKHRVSVDDRRRATLGDRAAAAAFPDLPHFCCLAEAPASLDDAWLSVADARLDSSCMELSHERTASSSSSAIPLSAPLTASFDLLSSASSEAPSLIKDTTTTQFLTAASLSGRLRGPSSPAACDATQSLSAAAVPLTCAALRPSLRASCNGELTVWCIPRSRRRVSFRAVAPTAMWFDVVSSSSSLSTALFSRLVAPSESPFTPLAAVAGDPVGDSGSYITALQEAPRTLAAISCRAGLRGRDDRGPAFSLAVRGP